MMIYIITYIVLLSSMKLQETKKTKFSMYHVSVCKAINEYIYINDAFVLLQIFVICFFALYFNNVVSYIARECCFTQRSEEVEIFVRSIYTNFI